MSSKFYCCGFNGFEQLFCRDKSKHTFKQCGIVGVIDAAFSWSCMYVLTNGAVFASGFADNKPHVLMRVKYPKDVQISAIACASRRCHALLLATDGQCFVYEGSNLKEVPNFISTETSDSTQDSRITQVCCGEVVNLAVSNTGVAYNIPSPIVLTPQIKVTSVACGFEHNLLLTETGAVYSWGIGSRGQLGHGCLDDEESPRQISALTSIVVMAVSAGGWHSVIIDDLGELWSWGWNNEGQLGFPSTKATKGVVNVDPQKLVIINISSTPITVPMRPDFNSKIVQAACGTRHTVALADDGTLWGCGWNEYSQLAQPTKHPNFYRMIMLDVPEGKITKVICGSWNTGILVTNEEPNE